MSRSVIEMIAGAMAMADQLGNEPDHFASLVRAGLKGAREELAEKRGDPRSYGQGFADPLGALIYHIDALLSEKPVG